VIRASEGSGPSGPRARLAVPRRAGSPLRAFRMAGSSRKLRRSRMTLLCWPPDLERIPRSGVRVLGAPEVGDALTRIEAHARVRPLARRVVVRHWEWLPDLDQLLDEALAALAASAACLWPAWYGREDVDGRPGSPSLVRAADRRTLSEIGAEIPELSTAWAELAFPRCRAGVAPTVHALPRAIQAEQLALALDPQGVLLVLACTDADPPEERVLALAKAAEWLARGYRVLRVTHDEVMADAELALEKIRDVVRLCRPSTP